MIGGELYDPRDPELEAGRARARGLLARLNAPVDPGEHDRSAIVRELLGAVGKGCWIEPPFFCDYGSQITLGDRVFMNFNCVVLDPAPVQIGDDVMLGPAVQLLTATHPLSAAARRGRELAHPITIESDVWLGGGVIVLPGVRIGRGAVIGAGSVVTRDVPQGVVAAGNPCRVMRLIPADDSDGAGS